jgi:hypothetical protein
MSVDPAAVGVERGVGFELRLVPVAPGQQCGGGRVVDLGVVEAPAQRGGGCFGFIDADHDPCHASISLAGRTAVEAKVRVAAIPSFVLGAGRGAMGTVERW